MNTTRRQGWMAALLLMATALPVVADDMTMLLPIVVVPFLVAGVVLALVLRSIAKRTQVRTGLLIGILVVVAILTGIPGTIGACISIPYVASRFADIAIPFLIGCVVYVVVMVMAFRSILKRTKVEPDG